MTLQLEVVLCTDLSHHSSQHQKSSPPLLAVIISRNDVQFHEEESGG
jgi:hypothetical protein